MCEAAQTLGVERVVWRARVEGHIGVVRAGGPSVRGRGEGEGEVHVGRVFLKTADIALLLVDDKSKT